MEIFRVRPGSEVSCIEEQLVTMIADVANQKLAINFHLCYIKILVYGLASVETPLERSDDHQVGN